VPAIHVALFFNSGGTARYEDIGRAGGPENFLARFPSQLQFAF